MTDMSDLLAIEEQANHNIKQLAAELGFSERELTTGASREEKKQKAQKASLFGTTQKADGDDRDEADVVVELMQQNAENMVRLCEAAGVSKRDIKGEATASKLDRQKADFFTTQSQREQAEKNRRARESY